MLCSELLRRCFAAHAPASPRLELSADRINLHQVLQPCLKATVAETCLSYCRIFRHVWSLKNLALCLKTIISCGADAGDGKRQKDVAGVQCRRRSCCVDAALMEPYSPGRLIARPAKVAKCMPCWRRASAPGAALKS